MNAYETALTLTVMAKAGEDGTVDTYACLGVEQDNLPLMGYYVGGVRPSFVVTDVKAIDRSELAWFIGTTPNARYFGVWVDSDTGKIYFDAVNHVYDRAEAIKMGRERGEIAIWDIAGCQEIRVNENSRSQWEIDEANRLNP